MAAVDREALREQVAQVVAYLQARAVVDRAHGRETAAVKADGFAGVIEEFVRRTDNTIVAHQASIALLERQLKEATDASGKA